MEGEGERFEMKRICLDRVSSEVIEVPCSDSEVKSVRGSWGSSECVPVVPPVVHDVTVPVSDVNLKSLSGTPFLSPKKAKHVWFWKVRRKRRWR